MHSQVSSFRSDASSVDSRYHRNRTLRRLKRERKAGYHPSYDIDGDGTVSSTDLKLSRQFDQRRKGCLSDEDRQRGRLMMATSVFMRTSSSEADAQNKAREIASNPNFTRLVEKHRQKSVETKLKSSAQLSEHLFNHRTPLYHIEDIKPQNGTPVDELMTSRSSASHTQRRCRTKTELECTRRRHAVEKIGRAENKYVPRVPGWSPSGRYHSVSRLESMFR